MLTTRFRWVVLLSPKVLPLPMLKPPRFAGPAGDGSGENTSCCVSALAGDLSGESPGAPSFSSRSAKRLCSQGEGGAAVALRSVMRRRSFSRAVRKRRASSTFSWAARSHSCAAQSWRYCSTSAAEASILAGWLGGARGRRGAVRRGAAAHLHASQLNSVLNQAGFDNAILIFGKSGTSCVRRKVMLYRVILCNSIGNNLLVC